MPVTCQKNNLFSQRHVKCRRSPRIMFLSFDELIRSSVIHINLRRNSDYQFPSVRPREVIECTKRNFRQKTVILMHEYLLKPSAWAVAVLASDVALFKSNYLYLLIMLINSLLCMCEGSHILLSFPLYSNNREKLTKSARVHLSMY
jgi:hypothetical protein